MKSSILIIIINIILSKYLIHFYLFLQIKYIILVSR